MKTIANCTPVEFLRQTNKIRHAASDLLKDSGIMEIRKHMPELTGKEEKEEKDAKMRKQIGKNLDDMLDALMDKHAEKTAEVLALMCFMEPHDMQSATAIDFVSPAIEIVTSKPVMDFLLSLAKLERMSTDA